MPKQVWNDRCRLRGGPPHPTPRKLTGSPTRRNPLPTGEREGLTKGEGEGNGKAQQEAARRVKEEGTLDFRALNGGVLYDKRGHRLDHQAGEEKQESRS